MLTLEQVLNFRRRMVRLPCLDPEMDRIAPKRLLFELCRSGETYFLKRTFDEKIVHVRSGKVFVFVVLASRPTQVFCVPAYSNSTADEINFRNFPPELELGHTSITRASPVFYAGEFVLEKSELFAWDNESGHYKPTRYSHEINLLPPVKHLLPLRKRAPAGGAEAAFRRVQRQRLLNPDTYSFQ
ncbi:hypothetical protein [Endozoicomonas lisbonensis]|uniref:Uncharacterized protein n=1 Tax=Endozoicomonas lisbonensis TaxID=3120522 RepID=A0ABV2SDD4_9GAMM